MRQISRFSPSDLENAEVCELCGKELADILISGYEVCRGCVREVKKLTKIKEEDEE